MPAVFLLFMDGVGLGLDDPGHNPWVAARTPTLDSLLGGRRLVARAAPFEGETATLLAIDASLGVEGLPQSASGQAALLTGRNVPLEIGGHYGPKPNQAIRDILREDNLFLQVVRSGGTAALLNAYPPRYYEAIESGRRLYSAIPFALTVAGLRPMTSEDLEAERAFSPDFTGDGWRSQPGFPPAPSYAPEEAGRRLALATQAYTLAWFDYWPADYAGHRGSLADAIRLVETVDGVLAGLVSAWNDRADLLVLTSDHGNLEDLRARGHTRNPVPGLLIGPRGLRRQFAANLCDLTHFYPAVLQTIRSPAP